MHWVELESFWVLLPGSELVLLQLEVHISVFAHLSHICITRFIFDTVNMHYHFGKRRLTRTELSEQELWLFFYRRCTVLFRIELLIVQVNDDTGLSDKFLRLFKLLLQSFLRVICNSTMLILATERILYSRDARPVHKSQVAINGAPITRVEDFQV